MKDRLGRSISIGEVVSVKDHPELEIKVNWIVIGFVNYELGVEVILRNFIDGSIIFIPLMDIEKEYY